MLTHAVLLPKYQSTDNEFITNGAYQIAERQEKQIALAKILIIENRKTFILIELFIEKFPKIQSINSLDFVLNAKSSCENLIYLPQLCVYFYEFNFLTPI